ncbi:MAG: leucyl aminopeptidase family protein [Alphaproteobacteria bacterium]|nr:leucyl aminopeptidase family protein [Alphaproteobacteria bacterium]MBT5389845.1 leucyl aminopeptidase family protein [Alphaproteobacteria bacterium]MBT5540971.1 leucyl aminopeptidase family protein [Alphaproteobacteria bacterium]
MKNSPYVLAKKATNPVPIYLLTKKALKSWSLQQSLETQNWIQATNFKAAPGTFRLVPTKEGHLDQVLFGTPDDFWTYGVLAKRLPHHHIYEFKSPLSDDKLLLAILAWGLSAYSFDKLKSDKPERSFSKIIVPPSVNFEDVSSTLNGICLVRDLINTPASHLGPQELVEEVQNVAKQHKATCHVISGDDLIEQNYPAVHTVGKSSHRLPHVIDLKWGNPKHPQLTLVGKGVTFDTGGLDLKPSGAMKFMKKDMGGAAHALALAQMIMDANLPISLRLLIGAVENSVSSQAMRPLDVTKTRNGMTVEIGNTDAEGRLVLADLLTEASSQKPNLIIDFATLTGAARVALGPDVPVFFTNRPSLAQDLMKASEVSHDPFWQLPLWKGYDAMIETSVADLSNNPTSPYGGAITAGLFLEKFISNDTPWIHTDLMAWNLTARPGRPKGGEAMGLRAMYEMVNRWVK